MEVLDSIAQGWIVIFGCAAIWLVGRREHWRCWGYALGLLSQPAWLFTSVYNEQWGLVLISLWYVYSWCQGLWNHRLYWYYWSGRSLEGIKHGS